MRSGDEALTIVRNSLASMQWRYDHGFGTETVRTTDRDDGRARASASDRGRYRRIGRGLAARGEIARSGDVRESELRLQREIEVVRKEIKEVELTLQKEIKEVELTLQKEIEGVRKEIKEVELTLQKEIEGVRKEIKEVELTLRKEIQGREEVELTLKEIKEVELNLQKEIKDAELRTRKAMHQQTIWLVGAVGTVVGLVKVLDWLMA